MVNRYEASRNVGTFAAGELWQLVTAPFTTVGEHWYTHEALDAQERFLAAHGEDLQTLATALQRASNALGAIQRAIRNARLDDPSSRLGGRGANDLRKLLDDLRRTFERGSDRFKEEHRVELEEREQHVAQKLATIEHVTGELRALAEKLPQLQKWMLQLAQERDMLRDVEQGPSGARGEGRGHRPGRGGAPVGGRPRSGVGRDRSRGGVNPQSPGGLRKVRRPLAPPLPSRLCRSVIDELRAPGRPRTTRPRRAGGPRRRLVPRPRAPVPRPPRTWPFCKSGL